MKRPKTKPTRARITMSFTIDFERELDGIPTRGMPDMGDVAWAVLRATKAVNEEDEVVLEDGARFDVALVHGKRAAKGGAT